MSNEACNKDSHSKRRGRASAFGIAEFLSIASLLACMASICVYLAPTTLFFRGPYQVSLHFILIFVLAAFAAVLGVAATLICLKRKRKNRVRNLGFVGGVLLCVVFFPIAAGELIRTDKGVAYSSEINILRVFDAIKAYALSHGGFLPDADKWCEILMESDVTLTEDVFKNPMDSEVKCGIAFNNSLSGAKLSEVSGKVIILFESHGTLNMNGGRELIKKSCRRGFVGVVTADGYFAILDRPSNQIEGSHPNLDYSRSARWR